jgi:hypothetical protein
MQRKQINQKKVITFQIKIQQTNNKANQTNNISTQIKTKQN